MKRVAAVLLATMMVFSLAACSSSESSSEESTEEKAEETTEAADEADEEVEFDVEPEFDPVEGYDKYTVVNYEIAGADVIVTVCEKNDFKDFELLCNFYGDDQDWVGTYDNGTTTMESDLTGFMDGDAAGIIEKAIDQDKWKTIG